MEQLLDERIAQELRERYQSLKGKGALYSDEQLARYYSTFRSRFGPEKLKNLDGEALLETMHSHGNKDSLVYWLEFKDDEEFPSVNFGSIAGGSAFKFGLFRKRETGKWTIGSSRSQSEITVEEAVEKARLHRDQLIKGEELLERLPLRGTDEDYEQLQQDMKRLAPDVSDLAWGHKYFSLLHPDKLDDYHNPDYQRFHLIRLLQVPPQGHGRYIAASRFLSIAKEVNCSMNNLTTLLNIRDGGDPYSYWRIGTKLNSDNQDYWSMMRDGNCVAIGWDNVGNLTGIANDKDGKTAIASKLHSAYPDMAATSVGKAAQQMYQFRWTIASKDLVLASDGATVRGVGRVTGGYTYNPSSGFPHQLPVAWLSLEEWKQPDQNPDIEGKLTTVYRMKRDANLLEAEKRIYGAQPILINPSPPLSVSSPPPENAPAPQFLPVVSRLSGIPGRIQAILERKGQVILYGPPGTGKTYWAELTARELAASANFGVPFAQLTPQQRSTIVGDGHAANGKVRICCFHPAYGYEDFLEGFRPQPINGQMQFVARNGIFKQVCEDAVAAPEQKFYLIIDEINRGDIPRIFGELLMVLERDKRGKTILLPLTNQPFQVPENVCIIGTMNTADRSIALLDTALRRRFGFIELLPDYELLREAAVGNIPLGLWLEALNQRICAHVGRDARNLQIGHAYLMEQGKPITDIANFAQAVQDDIIPLLEEYCYEDYTKLEKILGSALVDSSKQAVRHELFASTQRMELLNALLAPCPEITTSTQAAAIEAEALQEKEEDTIADESGEEQ